MGAVAHAREGRSGPPASMGAELWAFDVVMDVQPKT
jgi:hypothetical protein